MSLIDEFASGLSSTGHDDLIMALQSMVDGLSARRLDEIDRDLSAAVGEIEKINEVRSRLSDQRALLERMVKRLDSFLSRKAPDMEATLLRQHLSNQVDSLRVRIAETRPDEALKRKHDLVQERKLLESGQQVAAELLGRIRRVESGMRS